MISDAVAAAFKRISIEKERISSREVVGVQLISVAPSDAKHVEDIERQRSEFLWRRFIYGNAHVDVGGECAFAI